MRATVDSVMSQLASLESAVNNTANSSRTNGTLGGGQNDILQQALKNSGLPNKNEIAPIGSCFLDIHRSSQDKYFIYDVI